MAMLSVSAAGDLCLYLSGADEDNILSAIRRWPYWQRVTIERSPENSAVCLSVTLVTDATYEGTLRHILKHGFGMTFPVEGGVSERAPQPKGSSSKQVKKR
jgi:hypothetical protein